MLSYTESQSSHLFWGLRESFGFFGQVWLREAPIGELRKVCGKWFERYTKGVGVG